VRAKRSKPAESEQPRGRALPGLLSLKRQRHPGLCPREGAFGQQLRDLPHRGHGNQPTTQSEVIQRGQRVAVWCFESGPSDRQMRPVGAIPALSSDNQAPAQGFACAVGVGVAEREAVGEKRERERMWVVGGFGGLRAEARQRHGWIMDIYLLRPGSSL